MRRLLVLALALLTSSLACAISVEPIGGAQSTRGRAFFRNPIGVIVRDDNGKPMPGVEVDFSYPRDGDAFGSLLDLANPYYMFTDGRGIATTRVIAGWAPGVLHLTARVGDVERALPPLTVLPFPVADVQLVSGGGQSVMLGQPLDPWKVRAIDEGGRGVPYGAVEFHGGGVTFNGAYSAWAMADASGVATAPRPIVARVAHADSLGLACAYDYACVRIPYRATDWRGANSAAFVSGPPLSMENGATAVAPFVVRVLDASGKPAPGVPVTFYTTPIFDLLSPCGKFGDTNEATVATDAAGLATSPLFSAFALTMACPIAAIMDGLSHDEWPALSVYVYDPGRVRLQSPSSIITTAGRPFEVTVAFNGDEAAFGMVPIYGLPLAVEVVGASNGATARLAHAPGSTHDSNEVTLHFNASAVAGLYHVAVTSGALRNWIVVDQRRR